METHDKDRFELLLDHAVKNYGKVEPRPGLEGRVLAGLDSQKEHALSVRKWILVLSSPALAILLIAAIWQWRRPNSSPKTPVPIAEVSRQSPAEPAFGAVPRAMTSPATNNPKLGKAARRTLARAQHNPPRLKHFPSERQLSQQEILVARYVARYPHEAALVAKRQQSFEEESREAEQAIESRAETSNE